MSNGQYPWRGLDLWIDPKFTYPRAELSRRSAQHASRQTGLLPLVAVLLFVNSLTLPTLLRIFFSLNFRTIARQFMPGPRILLVCVPNVAKMPSTLKWVILRMTKLACNLWSCG